MAEPEVRSAVVQALVWSFDHDKSMGNIADAFIRHLDHGGYTIVPVDRGTTPPSFSADNGHNPSDLCICGDPESEHQDGGRWVPCRRCGCEMFQESE